MTGRQTGGRGSAFLFLIVSLVAAMVAVVVIRAVLQSYQAQLQDVDVVMDERVIVAAHDLEQGRVIRADDLVDAFLPPDYVPNNAILERSSVVGRTARERILRQEFVRQERLADLSSGVGLSALIPTNMRGLTLDIAGGAAVSGFLSPGNYVDVLVTVTNRAEHATQTHTVLQAVRVLAITTNAGGAEGGSTKGRGRPAVTLMLNPEDAQRLAHAFSEGVITLTLRNDIDVTELETHGAVSTTFLGNSRPNITAIKVSEWKERISTSDGAVTIISGSDERWVNLER